MAAIHGYNAKVYLGAVAQTIVNHWTIETDYDLAVYRVFGQKWDKFLMGHQRASGSFAGVFDTASGADIWDGATQDRAVSPMYLYADSGTATNYYYGNVWPKLSVDVPHDGIGTFSVTWQAEDEWAKNPA